MPAKQGRLIALTQKIDAYVKEVPLAWEAYLKEKSNGVEQKKAESAAMRSVYPGDNNIGVRLKTWKKHKFWPEDATEEIEKTLESFKASLSEGIEQDEAESEAVKTVLQDYPHPAEALEIWKRCGVWSAESVRHTEEHQEEPSQSTNRPSSSEANSRMTGRRKQPKDRPRTSKDTPGTSQADFGLSREEIMAQLRALLAEITVEERKWFGKATGKAPEEDKFLQIGAKLPPELVLEFKNLPGRYAHHLERALKLYLMVLGSADR
jgi:hypothetical protein